MKRFQIVTCVISMMVLCGGLMHGLSAQDQKEWKKDLDNSGNIVKMTLTNPATGLGIEKELIFDIDAAGHPASGAVRFKNGFERPMASDEVRIYWEMFHGASIVWNNWQSLGKLNSMASGQIPNDWFGNESRLISNGNVELIGKLGSTGITGEYILEIDHTSGGPIHFTMGGVRQLQQLKR
jgi:hypothetical protein